MLTHAIQAWQFWRTKFGARPLQFTCTTKSPNVPAGELRSRYSAAVVQPFTRTDFSRRPFRFSASSVSNSLPQTVIWSTTLCLFLNLNLKLFVHSGFTKHWSDLPLTPLILRSYMSLYKFDYYYFYYPLKCICIGVAKIRAWSSSLLPQ